MKKTRQDFKIDYESERRKPSDKLLADMPKLLADIPRAAPPPIIPHGTIIAANILRCSCGLALRLNIRATGSFWACPFWYEPE